MTSFADHLGLNIVVVLGLIIGCNEYQPSAFIRAPADTSADALEDVNYCAPLSGSWVAHIKSAVLLQDPPNSCQMGPCYTVGGEYSVDFDSPNLLQFIFPNAPMAHFEDASTTCTANYGRCEMTISCHYFEFSGDGTGSITIKKVAGQWTGIVHIIAWSGIFYPHTCTVDMELSFHKKTFNLNWCWYES